MCIKTGKKIGKMPDKIATEITGTNGIITIEIEKTSSGLRINMRQMPARIFKGTADDASAPWVEDPMAKNWVTPQNH